LFSFQQELTSMRVNASSFFCAAVLAVTGGLATLVFQHPTLQAAPGEAAAAKPVESDMHEFMEYLFEPSYKRLRPLMAAAPADNAGWKGIKADSLVLAEGGNLLLDRLPEHDQAAWKELSTAVRDAGGSLYQAARKKDYPTARQHYEAMIKKCNACHQQFADGEHQLTP
jgi:hypothetical protein